MSDNLTAADAQLAPNGRQWNELSDSEQSEIRLLAATDALLELQVTPQPAASVQGAGEDVTAEDWGARMNVPVAIWDGLTDYRDELEAKNKALEAELARLREQVAAAVGVAKDLARLTYEAEAFRAIAIIKSRECDRAYDALGVDPIAVDKRTKEYKEWQRANLESNNAWAEFNNMLRRIGLYVVSPRVVEALADLKAG